uniref:Uncharacterized protein n=1 Tax=Romanomermis culicivorax TaxID=13658 RepID=A0A915JAL0_ROMCU
MHHTTRKQFVWIKTFRDTLSGDAYWMQNTWIRSDALINTRLQQCRQCYLQKVYKGYLSFRIYRGDSRKHDLLFLRKHFKKNRNRL